MARDRARVHSSGVSAVVLPSRSSMRHMTINRLSILLTPGDEKVSPDGGVDEVAAEGLETVVALNESADKELRASRP